MDSDSVPFSPDNRVDWWTNLSACMAYKGMPYPPRDLFSNPDDAFETLRSIAENVGEEARDALLVKALKTTFGAEWMLEAIEGAETMEFLAPAFYLEQLQDCVMRCNAMRPAPTVGNPLGNPGVADPGPRPEVWPTAPPDFREPAVDDAPEPVAAPPAAAPPRAARVAAAAAGGLVMAVGLIVYLDNRDTTSPPVLPSAPAAAVSSYSLHWNCGAEAQCADVMGGDSGVLENDVSESRCEADAQRQTAMVVTRPGGVGVWCQPGG